MREYDFIAGVGGLGAGDLFVFRENNTLGRNESRIATLTDAMDFCKLHIILHYVAIFTEGEFPVYAIGKIGNDAAGNRVKNLMGKAGISTEFVKIEKEARTMYSLCYMYPDGDGGNITSGNSASHLITEDDINAFFTQIKSGRRGIVLAAPEVPVSVRLHLLKRGRERGFYNVASVSMSEVKTFMDRGIFSYIDFLAINKSEMECILRLHGCKDIENSSNCFEILKNYNPNIHIVITFGGNGAHMFCEGAKYETPAIHGNVVSTAGAGDCFLGTLLAEKLYGVHLYNNINIAALAAAIKVGCKDSIDFSLNKNKLWEEGLRKKMKFTRQAKELFFKGGSRHGIQ